MSCRKPIGFEALVAYWLGELPLAEEQSVEAHFLGCAHCTARLDWLAALSAGVRAAVQAGTVSLAATRSFVDAMKRAGLRVREYRLDPGTGVECTIAADDHAVVGHMRAPLAGVKRVDALQRLSVGEAGEVRLADVPFDAAAGEVLYLPSAAWLKTMPANTMHVRLLAVDEAGERPLGEYAFHHTPQA